MEPGPASIGMPSGIMPTSSYSRLSSAPGSFLGRRAPRLEHIKTNEPENNATGNLESRQGNPKQAGYKASRDAEYCEDGKTGPGGALSHAAQVRAAGIARHDQERRDGAGPRERRSK